MTGSPQGGQPAGRAGGGAAYGIGLGVTLYAKRLA